jgi:hypothetical protein
VVTYQVWFLAVLHIFSEIMSEEAAAPADDQTAQSDFLVYSIRDKEKKKKKLRL